LLSKILQNYYARYLLIIGSIIGGYLVLVLQDGVPETHHIEMCWFKLLTGHPCPGCGMGHATLALFHGNIPGSFSYNILCLPFTLVMIVALLWAIADIIRHSESFVKFIRRDISINFKVILFAVILTDWVVNLIRL
jgi:hypothetical protein